MSLAITVQKHAVKEELKILNTYLKQLRVKKDKSYAIQGPERVQYGQKLV